MGAVDRVRETLAGRREIRAALSDVEGWLWAPEAWRLHEAARRGAPGGRPVTIVEIGSFRGRSTIARARGLRARGEEGRVYAIDPQDDHGHEELLVNLRRAGIAPLVEPVRLTSQAARSRFEGMAVDVLFVDGSHEYQDVLRDIDDWTPLLRPGAIVALNDPFWPGVNRAIRERVATRTSPFRWPRFCVNTIFIHYRPSEPWSRRDRRLLIMLRLVLRLGRLWHMYFTRVAYADRVPVPIRVALVWPAAMTMRSLFALMLPGRGLRAA